MENSKNIKRILTLFLAILMLITSVPFSIFATEGDNPIANSENTTQDGSTPAKAIDAT